MLIKNKLCLLPAFILLFISKSYAQQPAKAELTYGVHPGTVTTADGQTLQGYIINRNHQLNQKECIFYTNDKDERSQKIYKPDDLAGYTVENNQYKTISYSGNLSFGKANKNFFYVSKPGAITTYVYYAPQQQIFWQKGNEEPVSNSSMLFSFRKAVLKLVGDYPELAAKINNKEQGYGMMNLEQIIDEYNTWAASKK